MIHLPTIFSLSIILIGNSNFSWSKQVMYLLFRYFNFSVLVLFYHFLSCSALSFCNLTLLCPVPSSFRSTDLDVFFFRFGLWTTGWVFFFICHYFFSFFSSHGLVVSILFAVLFFSFYARMRCYAFIDDLIACLARWWWLLWLLDGLMYWLNGFTDSLGLNLRLETTEGQNVVLTL